MAESDLDLFVLASVGASRGVIRACRHFSGPIYDFLVYISGFGAERPFLPAVIT